MDIHAIKVLIEEKFGQEAVAGIETSGLQPALIIHPDLIEKVCLELRDNPATYFDFLACLSGVDEGVEAQVFGVVYHLSSIPYKKQLTLKVKKSHDRNSETMPFFPSVTSVWRTAEWHEREAYDLLGIFFEGHPDLRRILLPDDWEGYPLRKDYKTAAYYKGIKIDY